MTLSFHRQHSLSQNLHRVQIWTVDTPGRREGRWEPLWLGKTFERKKVHVVFKEDKKLTQKWQRKKRTKALRDVT